MRDAQDADVLSGDSAATGLGGLRVALPVAIAVVVLDQITKSWILATLARGSCTQPDACIDLFAGVRLNLVFNYGASFSTGSGYGPIFGILAMVMTVVLLVMSRARADRSGAALFGLIAGGAVGNLLDRLFRADDGFLTGAVIDFIDVGWWPVFNIADSAIVVGVIAVIAMTLLTPVEDDGKAAAAGDSGQADAEAESDAGTDDDSARTDDQSDDQTDDQADDQVDDRADDEVDLAVDGAEVE